MKDFLVKVNDNYLSQSCCHKKDDYSCNCYPCMRKSFFDGQDDYSCLKKLCYYSLNYGPAFVSEIYHFLAYSEIMESFVDRGNIRVLSLGCGFGSDLIAMNKYISENKLNCNLSYVGVDKEPLWENIRFVDKCADFYVYDVFGGFSFADYEIIFINKLFSTLRRYGLHEKFLLLVKEQIISTMQAKSILIFNDINHYDQGRDEFHAGVSNLFRKSLQCYFPISGAHNGNGKYEQIKAINSIVSIPGGISVNPKRDVTKTVFFAYQK